MSAIIHILIGLMLGVAAYAQEDAVVESNSTSYYPLQSMGNVITLQGKTYLFVAESCTFFEAVSFCRGFNMDLLSIETELESYEILQYLAFRGENLSFTRFNVVVAINAGLCTGWDKGIHFHISGNTLSRENNDWRWLNGESMTDYTNWQTGQPNYPDKHHCMHIYQSHWNSGPCIFTGNGNGGTGFICESR